MEVLQGPTASVSLRTEGGSGPTGHAVASFGSLSCSQWDWPVEKVFLSWIYLDLWLPLNVTSVVERPDLMFRKRIRVLGAGIELGGQPEVSVGWSWGDGGKGDL